MANATTTVTSLLPFQQKALEDLYKQTQMQVGKGLPIFQGPRVAPLDPNQQAGITEMADYAKTGAKAVLDPALSANAFWSDPNRVFDLNSVPGYGASRAGIESSVGRMLTESALPQIRGGAILNNQLGGSRQGIAEGEAVGRSTEALTSGLGNLDLNVAQMLLGANQNAIGRAPALAAAGAIPANLQLQAGGITQTQKQAEIDAQRQKFEEEANAPYFGLNQLRASLGAFPGGTGQTSTKEPSAGWLDTLLSLGLLGKSVGLFGGGSNTLPGIGGPIAIPH